MPLKALINKHRQRVDTTCEGMELCFHDISENRSGSIALDDCVGHLYFGFGSRGWNPFTQAVKAYLNHGRWEKLENYYQCFQPQSLAEAYFGRNHSRWEALNDRSPFLRLKPWRLSEKLMSGNEGGGNQNFGPVTPSKLSQEIRKYESIIHSIRKRGYQPQKYGTIRGYFLFDDHARYVFRITQGMHRAAVLDAMGWESFSVSFDPTMPHYVSLSSLCYWPKVMDGSLSPELARYMFKRHFWDRGNVMEKRLGDRL